MEQIIGKVGITTEGTYDSNKAYEKLSCVTYNGASWVSNKDVPAGCYPGSDAEYWQKMAEKGERGDTGPQGPQGNSAFDGTGVEIVNNLTDGGEAAVLSAEQGKILKTELTELESKVYSSNPFIQTESGEASSSSYPQYNTTSINIPDKAYFRIVTNATNPQMYIIWSDGSNQYISHNQWGQMSYPEGKTFAKIRILTDVPGENINVEVLTQPESWNESVANIASDISSEDSKQIESYIGKSPLLSANDSVKDFAESVLEFYVRPKFEVTDDIRNNYFAIGYWREDGVCQGGMQLKDGNWSRTINIFKTDIIQDGLTLWYADTDNYEVAFLADAAKYPIVSGYPSADFRFYISDSVHPAIRPLLDKVELSDRLNKVDSSVITLKKQFDDTFTSSKLIVAEENGNARITSDYWKKGTTVEIEVFEATSGSAASGGISFYGFIDDEKYDTLWSSPSGGNVSNSIVLQKDYISINCYATPSNVQYHYKLSIKSNILHEVDNVKAEVKELESYIGKSPVISAYPQVKDFADTILEIYVKPHFELTDDIIKDRFYLSYWGGNGVAQGGMQKTDGSWVAAINVLKTTYKQDGLTLWYANNDNYEVAFLADEALYPNVTGYPSIEFRISLSNSINPAIRAILDKKELTEKIESIDNTTLTDGIVYSELKVADEPGNARIYSEYFKAGNVVSLNVLEATSGSANDGGVSFYGFFADGTYETLWNAPAGGHTSKLIELSKDYDSINCYADPSKVQYHLTIGVVSSLYKDTEDNKSKINELTNSLNDAIDEIRDLSLATIGTRFDFPENSEDSPIREDLLLAGKKVTIVVTEDSLGEQYECYAHYVDESASFSYIYLGSPRKGETITTTLTRNCDYIRLHRLSGGGFAKAYVVVSDEDSLSEKINKLSHSGGFVTPIKALILGDSYSANGGAWVEPMMQMLPQGSSYISLAVSSATIKDRYADRAAYPYTSRPVSTDNAGNHNTLACQIEKLKRLMQGTDLDDGETAIYQSAEEYPNVIIIEGGMNDGTDANTDNYYDQLEKEVDGVWRKRYSWSDDLEQGRVTIKTPIDEVDRTCFAGAYRYLADELLQLFPDAQIFITTCSSISYRSGNSISRKRTIMAEQQRLCSDIFAFNLIDWHRDGQINSIANYPMGSGTESDPYIWGGLEGEYADTNDQLHPNARGGRKYGRLAALRIKQTFLNIGDL